MHASRDRPRRPRDYGGDLRILQERDENWDRPRIAEVAQQVGGIVAVSRDLTCDTIPSVTRGCWDPLALRSIRAVTQNVGDDLESPRVTETGKGQHVFCAVTAGVRSQDLDKALPHAFRFLDGLAACC
jgi:hypothetical protein